MQPLILKPWLSLRFFLPFGAILLALSARSTQAAPTALYWDADGDGGSTGGSGTWNTSSSLWRNGSTGGTLQAWPATVPSNSVAYFQGTAGTVTIASNATIYANGLNFGTTNYQIASGNASSKLVLNGSSPTVTIAANQTHLLNTAIELGNGTSFIRSSGADGGFFSIGSDANGSLTVANGASISLFDAASTSTLGVGRAFAASGTSNSIASVDFSGGKVTAYLAGLRVAQRASGGSGNITGTIDFGTHADTSIQITANEPVIIGVLGIGSSTYSGALIATMNTKAGSHLYTKNSNASTNGIKIGEFMGTGNNGSNLASAAGTWNISGGSTTLGITGTAVRADILLANRSSGLAVNSTSSGTINLTGGTLTLMAGDIIDGGGTSTFYLNGGTLNLNGGLLGKSGALIDNLTFQSGTLQNIGGINNGAGLTKNAGGTLTLAGANSFAGNTTVTVGTLIINGNKSGTGTVNIGASATLGGTGTIAGATTISGHHTPGNSPGVQTFSSDLTYTDGSSVTWELIGNTEAGRGVNFDGIDVIGAGSDLTITGTSTINLVFNAGSSVAWADSFWNTDHSWLFYDVSGSRSGSFALGNISADSLGNALGSRGTFSINPAGSDVWIHYTAAIIPEPASILLLAGGLMTIGLFRRRRKA